MRHLARLICVTDYEEKNKCKLREIKKCIFILRQNYF
jgi:hypothetical protein